MTFNQFKERFQENFPKTESTLYLADVDKDLMWETFLNSFASEEIRQSYNCNCCKQFIRNYGNIVSIKDGKATSIWDFEASGELENTAKDLNTLVSNAAVNNVFVTSFAKLGTNKSSTLSEDGKAIVWQHLFVELPKTYVKKGAKSEEAIQGELRDNANVFKRGLNELTQDAIETVIELIDQNSIYRGSEFKQSLLDLLKIKKEYDALDTTAKNNFAWERSTGDAKYITKIRNQSIGTLLIDISEGRDLDQSVRAFEKIMAPSNYKRPNAIVTQAMISKAENEIETLGLTDSLGRRFATSDDVSVSNVLFVDRAKQKTSIFTELAEDVAVNPKSFSKVEEVDVKTFVEKILPKSKSIELLVENTHVGNFVSLIAPKSAESPSLFKWDNGFSWSYRNAIADSMREKVVAAGGRVDGVFRFTHSWNHDGQNQSLMDLHVFFPTHKSDFRVNSNGKEIHDEYGNFERVGWNNRNHSGTGGVQDVDFVNAPDKAVPLENITFPSLGRMPEGVYICKVHNWSKRPPTTSGFKAEIEVNGEIHSYEYTPALDNKEWITVAHVTLKNGIFTVEDKLPSSTSTKEVWGINTNKFHRVNMIAKSPNFWGDKAVGNEHLFFFIDKVHNDEIVRGFFNEFLKNDLLEHKRVFEALGSKMKVEPAEVQLSGLGFSSTQKSDVIVKVEGSFSRVIKIKF